MGKLFGSILRAIKRAKGHILAIFLIYCISCSIGIIMSHSGSHLALNLRDKIINRSVSTSRASIDYQKGNNFRAAVYDFCGNLFLGAVPQTVMGIGIIVPFISVPVQGWIAGIVSVDASHQSRFRKFRSAAYYLIVLLLQFIPYSLTIGSGVKFGIDCYNYNRSLNTGMLHYKIKKESLTDLGYIFLLAVPLFFIASCFEFLSPWNA